MVITFNFLILYPRYHLCHYLKNRKQKKMRKFMSKLHWAHFCFSFILFFSVHLQKNFHIKENNDIKKHTFSFFFGDFVLKIFSNWITSCLYCKVLGEPKNSINFCKFVELFLNIISLKKMSFKFRFIHF